MARLRALDLVRPFTVLMPEVQKAYGKVDIYERLIYVVCGGVLYAILSELPLYGVTKSLEAPDAIGNIRYVLGSSNGTPLDIGPAVIYLSGFLLQGLAGFKLLNVNLDLRSDRGLFQSAQKLLAILLTIILSLLVVLSGNFGSPSVLGVSNTVFLTLQLVAGNIALILIDEVFTKGHGLGTGLLVFSTLKCAQKFSWELLGMLNIETVTGNKTFGALPNLFFNLNSRSIKYSVVDSAFRQGLPNITSLMVAVLAFLSFAWLSTLRVNLQIASTRARSQQQSFPIRILYTNAQPILFTASVLSVIYTINSSIFLLAPQNQWVKFLGEWQTVNGQRIPVSGLTYYLSAPTNFDPLRAISYGLFVTFASGFFARVWTESSGFSATDMTRTFKEQSVSLVGRRDQSVYKELKKTINPISILGGLITGAAAAAFDMFGGWGMVMGAGVLNMLNVFEILGSENITQDTLMGATRALQS